MSERNQRLVAEEPVEFEKKLVKVQDFKKFIDHFMKIYRIYLERIKQNRKMSTCNWLDVESLGSRLTMPKNFLDTAIEHTHAKILVSALKNQVSWGDTYSEVANHQCDLAIRVSDTTLKKMTLNTIKWCGILCFSVSLCSNPYRKFMADSFLESSWKMPQHVNKDKLQNMFLGMMGWWALGKIPTIYFYVEFNINRWCHELWMRDGDEVKSMCTLNNLITCDPTLFGNFHIIPILAQKSWTPKWRTNAFSHRWPVHTKISVRFRPWTWWELCS